MAIDTITVTKVSVSEPREGMVNVSLNLTCLESAVEVINKDFSQVKKDHITIAQVRDRFIEDMQAEINRWNREQILFDHATFDAAVAAIQAALEA